jgi:hypothetical protein
MALTLVKGNMIEDGTLTDPKFVNTTITSADMALDPRDADNFSSGQVPLARLGNVPAVDLTGLDDDIALLGFKAAANGSLAKYNLVDQTVDAFEDASGVDAGSSTNEIRNASKYYSGSETVTATVTGGTITTDGDYKVHTFTGNGNYISDASLTTDYFVLAGGGGGGGRYGGGGGAGGYRIFESQTVAAGTYAVVVGTGGAGGVNTQQGTQGLTSSFIGGSISSASTGGGGGNRESAGAIPAGGSGGGGSYVHPSSDPDGGIWPPGDGNAGSYTPVEGYPGGDGFGSGNMPGGGGGGAGAVGGDAGTSGWPTPSYGYWAGAGGVGRATDISVSGTPVYYAGGGGGGIKNTPEPNKPPPLTPAPGGDGGGGAGGLQGTSSGVGANATNYGSGGGGGGGAGANGGQGSAGIVIVRRPITYINYLDMTLVSTATTAQAVPTKCDMVMTYTNGAGTAVINTNIKGYVSRDGGTTYTQGTLVSQGTTGGHTIATFHDLDISGQPSGSSMRYKIETLVQSASMATRIQAVSLGWS